ncbi:MAG: MarR family winged helix-turn-helix transcriptional regulator [Acidobacteriota bacterium]
MDVDTRLDSPPAPALGTEGPRRISDAELETMASEIASSCACFHLRQAARVVTRAYDRALDGIDLKITQLTMLVAVAKSQGRLSLVELADRLGMDRSTFSRNLGPLERRALVTLSAEGRHRARTVELTAAGRQLLAQAAPRWRAAQAELDAQLGAEETTALLRQLRRLDAADLVAAR